jgi:Ca2+-binding RTX toxin-like protein
MVVRIGGPGNDTLIGTADDDRLDGRAGNDRLFGRHGGDDLLGGTGNDRADGEGGDDDIQGEVGDDILNGNDGDDLILGGVGFDRVNGGSGNDGLRGNGISGGNDFSADVVSGGAGADRIFGNDGSSDTLRGDAGNDNIEVNNDDAFGGSGDDRLETFHSDGRLTGGGGADTFSLHTQTNDGFGETVVTDFTPQDTLALSAHDIDFNFDFTGNLLFNRLDRNGNNRLDGNDGFSTQPEGVRIGVDADRDSLTITLGDDDFDFLNVSSIARTDWA